MQKKIKSFAGSIRPFISVVVLMLLLTVPALPSKTSAEPASNAVQRVLIISSFDRLLPAGIAAEQALRKSVSEGYEIIVALPDGSGLTAALERHSPAIVLLDITLPGESGLELATRLRLEGHPCKVVILSVHDDPDYVRAALAAGADGYVVKSQLAVDLVPALKAVLAGRKFVSPDRLPPRFM